MLGVQKRTEAKSVQEETSVVEGEDFEHDSQSTQEDLGENKPQDAESTQEETSDVEGGNFEHDSGSYQEETKELEGVPKCSVSEMEQEDATPTSVFTHVTSVTPVENPWVCLAIVFNHLMKSHERLPKYI